MFEEAVSNIVSSPPFVTTSNFLLTSHLSLLFFCLFVALPPVASGEFVCFYFSRAIIPNDSTRYSINVLFIYAPFLFHKMDVTCFSVLSSRVSLWGPRQAPHPSFMFHLESCLHSLSLGRCCVVSACVLT